MGQTRSSVVALGIPLSSWATAFRPSLPPQTNVQSPSRLTAVSNRQPAPAWYMTASLSLPLGFPSTRINADFIMHAADA